MGKNMVKWIGYKKSRVKEGYFTKSDLDTQNQDHTAIASLVCLFSCLSRHHHDSAAGLLDVSGCIMSEDDYRPWSNKVHTKLSFYVFLFKETIE